MKKNFILHLFIGGLCILLLTPQSTYAQKKDGIERSAFWGNSEKYLNRQAFKMFDLIDQALTENPPVTGAPMNRKLALYNLDAMLHETKYDNGKPLGNFIASRMDKVITDLSSPVKKGMKVYKIYNEGIVARTASVTLAFDLARGWCQGKTLLPDALVQQIVDRCDILFLTHNHGDHVDPVVVDELMPTARYSGVPELPRISIFHALNQKAVAKRYANEKGVAYDSLNLIVVHMGGGVSVGAHEKGKVVDVFNALDGDGAFSPERAGAVPPGALIKMCFSGKYTEKKFIKNWWATAASTHT